MSKDAQQKYNSRAAQLYRDKLLQSAKQAMKTYGTQVFNTQKSCIYLCIVIINFSMNIHSEN